MPYVTARRYRHRFGRLRLPRTPDTPSVRCPSATTEWELTMGHLSPALRRTIRRQHGVVAGAQLRDGGITPEQVDRWRLRRLIVTAHVDIHRVVSAPDTLESRCVTATLAHSNAVVGGAAAAALWDFDHVFRPTRPECVHHHTTAINTPVRGVAYRPLRSIDEHDIVERGDAIRVLSRAATWLDCVGDMNLDHGRRFTAHVLDSQCDLDELWDAVTRREAMRRGRPGRGHAILSTRSLSTRSLSTLGVRRRHRTAA